MGKSTQEILEAAHEYTDTIEQALEDANARIKELKEERDCWKRLIEEAVATGDLPLHIQDGMEHALAGEGAEGG